MQTPKNLFSPAANTVFQFHCFRDTPDYSKSRGFPQGESNEIDAIKLVARYLLECFNDGIQIKKGKRNLPPTKAMIWRDEKNFALLEVRGKKHALLLPEFGQERQDIKFT